MTVKLLTKFLRSEILTTRSLMPSYRTVACSSGSTVSFIGYYCVVLWLRY